MKPTRIDLNRLTLQNFEQVRQSDDRPMGRDVIVQGANGTGKSTRANALTMLLLQCSEEWGGLGEWIKTTDQDVTSKAFGQPVHKLEHVCEGEFGLGDGDAIVLKAIYREKWEKPSGSDKEQMSGHETIWHVDGVPKTLKDYQGTLEAICAKRWLRLILTPSYFFERMKTDEQRALLMELTGEVTDAEVIATDKKLKDLPAILGRRSVSEHRAKIKSDADPIRKQKAEIPIQIRTINGGLPELVPGDHAGLLTARRDRLKGLQARRADASKSSHLTDLRNEVRRLESEMDARKRQLELLGDPARDKALEDFKRLTREISDAAFHVEQLERKIKSEEADVLRYSAKAEAIKEEREALKAQAEAKRAEGFAGSSLCPSCGQDLPEEQRAAVLAKFNADKAAVLERLQKSIDAKLDEWKAANTARKLAIAILAGGADQEGNGGLRAGREAAEAKLASLRVQLSDLIIPEPKTAEIAEDKAWLNWRAERDAAQLKIETSDTSDGTEAIDAEIAKVNGLIEEANRAQLTNERHASELGRIAALETKEKDLAVQIEDLDRQAHLCDLFVIAKAHLLTDRINSKFQFCRFTLFRPNLSNEGIQEVCELSFQGAPPSKGQQILCGLDLHNVICEHVGFVAPVLVINAESLTTAMPTRGQQIRFRAVEELTELTVRMIDRADAKEMLFA